MSSLFKRSLGLVIILSLLPLFYILVDSRLPHTHDGFVHLARMAAYYKALSDGQFPVRWAGDLNYGYGMPLFNFMYQVPYLISSFFILLGFGLVTSFKLVLAVSYIFSGIFMFLFGKAFFRDEKKALLVTIFYQFAPFRLVELFVRGSFGEVYTYTFFPLVLYGLTKLFQKLNYKNFLITALATALLILSHNALSLSFFGIAVLFALFFAKSKQHFLVGMCALIIGMLLSTFYWLPAIIEHKYTYGDLFMKEMYKEHFPPVQDFFIPNVNNDVKFQTGGISIQFGLFHEIAILLGIALLIRHPGKRGVDEGARLLDKRGSSISRTSSINRFWTSQNDEKLIIFCLLIFGLILFFMQPISTFVWQHISLLRQFQFPWRLLGLIAFTTSLIAVTYYSFSFFKNKWALWILLGLVIISTFYYWKPPLGFDKVDENYYWNFPLNTTYFGETDIIWSAGPAKSYPKHPVELIAGDAKITQYQKKSYQHTFLVGAKNQSQFVDHTQYFPGWKVLVDNVSIPIQFQDPNWRGQITFHVPSGKHNVLVKFTESPIRLIADMVSVVTIVLLVVLFFFRDFHPHPSLIPSESNSAAARERRKRT